MSNAIVILVHVYSVSVYKFRMPLKSWDGIGF